MADARPIGVFDSGVGGLTVLASLRRRLPAERFTYLADLAHFPYGPRYQNEVRGFALAIIEHLVEAQAKLVVIACNTATAAALHAARERFDIPIVGVIAPGAQAAVEATTTGRVAVISTAGTFASQQYLHAMWEANPGVGILPKATPELVDIVEAGDADSPRADAALRPVVDEVIGWGADVLLLGCTHYPLLRPALDRVAVGSLVVVDSAATTAARVERILAVNRLAAGGETEPPPPRLEVTADPGRFAAVAERFAGEALPPPHLVPLWESAARVAVAS